MTGVWRQMWPWRVWCTLAGLLRGIRIAPSALIEGPLSRVRLASGTSIGSRTRIQVGDFGKMATGENVWLSSDVEIQTDTLVWIGARTTIQRRCTINGSTRVGADCIFAPDVFISSGTHPFKHLANLPIREQERRVVDAGDPDGLLDRPVWIQDDCWLGVHSVVSPGVTVGKGSIVGANSVVTADVPPYSVVAGNPARVIGKRLNWSPPQSIDLRDETAWIYVLSGKAARNALGTLEGARQDEHLGLGLGFALQVPEGPARVKIWFTATTESQWKVNGLTATFAPPIGSIELLVEFQRPSFEALALHLQSISTRASDADTIITAVQIDAEDKRL